MDEHDEQPEQGNGMPDDENEALKQKRNHLLSELDRMERANRETMTQLERRGMNPNSLVLTRLRTEILISALLGNQDSLQRLQFELVWQRELREHFASLYQQSKDKKIHVPGRD